MKPSFSNNVEAAGGAAGMKKEQFSLYDKL